MFIQLIILILLLVLFIIVINFSFPQFSPVPYYPSNKKDLPLIIKALDIKNDQIIIDLGAGDGLVIFEAAKQSYKQKLNTLFVAVEINPVLILILRLRRLFHPNKKNVKIIWVDMFKINLESQMSKIKTTVYLYISPWFLEKITYQIKQNFPNSKIVSYYYPIKSLKSNQKVIKGKNKIFIYNIK